MPKCEGRKAGYLSPWDREQGNAPYDLVCQLDAGHEGYHVDQDRLPFGPYLLTQGSDVEIRRQPVDDGEPWAGHPDVPVSADELQRLIAEDFARTAGR